MKSFLILIPILLLLLMLPAHADCTVTVASKSGGFTRACTPEEIQQQQLDESRPVVLPPFEQIKTVYSSAKQEKPETMTGSMKLKLLMLTDAVERALQFGDFDAARVAINEAALPLELEPYRQQMLDALPNP